MFLITQGYLSHLAVTQGYASGVAPPPPPPPPIVPTFALAEHSGRLGGYTVPMQFGDDGTNVLYPPGSSIGDRAGPPINDEIARRRLELDLIGLLIALEDEI